MIEMKVVRIVILNNIDIHDQLSRMHHSRSRQNFPDLKKLHSFYPAFGFHEYMSPPSIHFFTASYAKWLSIYLYWTLRNLRFESRVSSAVDAWVIQLLFTSIMEAQLRVSWKRSIKLLADTTMSKNSLVPTRWVWIAEECLNAMNVNQWSSCNNE